MNYRTLMGLTGAHVFAGLVMILALLLLGCAGAAPATPAPTTPPGVTAQPGEVAAPTPAPTQVPAPAVTQSGKSDLRIAMHIPPSTGDIFTEGGNLYRYYWANTTDDLVHIDRDTFETVGLSGVSGWEQVEPDRWRFRLRQGVKFHNGEPFNAEAAKLGIDTVGNPRTGSPSYQLAGAISGEVVDEYTVDVVCAIACPTLPVNAQYIGFQAPEWYLSYPVDAQSGKRNPGKTVGFGPFQFLDWRRAEFLKLERYEGYAAVPGREEAQFSQAIKNIHYVWREEAAVRAAMLIAGETDLAYSIDLDDIHRVPATKVGGETSVFSASLDNMWDPWLSQPKFRKALAHAVDCEALVASLFGGQTTCRGHIIFPGVLGATEKNTTWYEYNPELSRQLLQEIGYNGEVIPLFTETGRAIRKQLEVAESLAVYWRAVGINTSMQVIDFNRWLEIWRSGAGACPDPFQALQQGPCPPSHISRGILLMAPTNLSLDFARHLQYYIDCTSVVAVKCDPWWQERIPAALSSVGEERRLIMEELATKYHEEVMDIGFFDIPIVWGMSSDLVWEPRFDSKIRSNTMSFR